MSPVPTMDLDFETIEKMLDGTTTKKRKKVRSQSRSLSRRRSRSRDRRRRDRVDREKERTVVAREEEVKQRRKAIEDANRSDRTILVLSLNAKADEHEVYEFFSVHSGKVRDAEVIRDVKGRSKGVAYIEFYHQDSVLKALACSGQAIMGVPIRVQPSHTDQNRAAVSSAGAVAIMSATGDGPSRLYIGGLVDSLATISEDDLRRLFGPFGDIDFIDLHRDPVTMKCKGYAFLQFKRDSDAKEAVAAMNGFQMAGKELKVGLANVDTQPATNTLIHPPAPVVGGPSEDAAKIDLDDDDVIRGMLKDGNSRARVMQAMSREAFGTNSDMTLHVQPPPGLMKNATPGMSSALPARNLVLRNMFSTQNVNISQEPNFFDDIKDDVTQEATKHGSVVHVHVDRASMNGTVYVRFSNMTEATSCKMALDKRWFGGQQIAVEFLQDQNFESSTGFRPPPGT